MARYRVYAQVFGGKFIGEFEADSKEEAISQADGSDECYVSVCHQCSRQVDDPQIGELEAELIEE